MTPFETSQIITSSLAILISVGSIIYSHYISKKQIELKIKENYYQPVFQDILLTEFPETFSKFLNVDKHIIYPDNSMELERLIGKFRKKIKFIQFVDEKFYKTLNDLLIQIDEDIVILCSDLESKDNKINTIKLSVRKLYCEINKFFT